MGLDVPWWWLGRRGNVSTHSSTGTKLEKKITCLCSLTCLNQMENLFINMFFFFVFFVPCVYMSLLMSQGTKKIANLQIDENVFLHHSCDQKDLLQELPDFSTAMGLCISRALCLSCSLPYWQKQHLFYTNKPHSTALSSCERYWAEINWAETYKPTRPQEQRKNNMDLTKNQLQTLWRVMFCDKDLREASVLGILKITTVEMFKNCMLPR